MITELLKECELIKVLSKEEQDLLSMNISKVQYSMGESIIKSGEFANHIIFIVKGFVKLHSDYQNKNLIITINRMGTFPGLATMIGVSNYKFNITALDDTVVCLININIFRYLIENNGYFAMQVFQIVNESLLQFIDHNLISLNYCNSHGRLANILLYLSKHVFCSNHFDLLLSRKELSQYTNISRENVIKILYEFSHEGIISIHNRHIQILQPELLQHYAEIS